MADTVTHVALSHPEVSIKFIREGKLQYVTPGDGQLRGAAYSVLGREFSRDLVEVDNQEGVYHIRGLITPPKSCRASRSMQHFTSMDAMSATVPSWPAWRWRSRAP